MIAERSELIRSLPARGGWEGRAFNSPFACFIIGGAAPLLHARYLAVPRGLKTQLVSQVSSATIRNNSQDIALAAPKSLKSKAMR